MILQDFTGVPAVVDLAAMRDAVVKLGGKASMINPLSPAELVIDHSVQVDHFGTPTALAANNAIEFERNRERYSFLRWGQNAFRNFRVVPPNTGIVHQVNLEYLSRVIFDQAGRRQEARLSRYSGRHGLAYDDDQRARDSRVGRRRHRGGGGDARATDHDAHPASRRFRAQGSSGRRRDGDRSGLDRDRDAAQARCRR